MEMLGPEGSYQARMRMGSEGRRLMAEQKTDKTEVRAMWIMVALVVLIIVAGMGWNMWTHPDWIHGN